MLKKGSYMRNRRHSSAWIPALGPAPSSAPSHTYKEDRERQVSLRILYASLLALVVMLLPASAHAFPGGCTSINRPTVRTIYPPMTQLIFGMTHSIGPARQELLKLVISGCDLAILGLVLLCLSVLGRNLNLALLYAWSPLILKEYSNSGHHDPVATALWRLFLAVSTSGFTTWIGLPAS